MLAADKLQLQSQLKQQAVSLKEKEFNLHHENLMTVGTQAAVLAGLDITMFIEFTPAPAADWGPSAAHVHRILQFVYYTMICAAFCSNMMVVSQTTVLSVLGAGLALRGPDGSMMVATDALYCERARVFSIFGWGLALTVSSVLVAVWLMLNWETAAACWMVAAFTCHAIYSNYRRVAGILDFDENDTVDFRDIMEGPASIRLARQKNQRQQQQRRMKHHNSNGNSNDGSGYRRNNSKGSGSARDGDYYHDDHNYYYSEDHSYSTSGSNDDVEMQSRKPMVDNNNNNNNKDRGGNSSRRRGGNSNNNHRRESEVKPMQTV